MPDAQTDTVPRTPEGPTTEDILDAMTPGEPYKVADLTEAFEDTSRWTVQRRLNDLHDDDRVQRKKHADGSVSWWIPEGTAAS